MQNRYVGDVADFGKHGLLRFLNGLTDTENPRPRLSVGLIWYLYHESPDNGDGRHISYLMRTPSDNREDYRECDPELWDTLRDLILRDARCVHCAEEMKLPLDGTRYASALLHFPKHMKPADRRPFRKFWFATALDAVEGTDIVCVDPDNGLGNEDEMYTKTGPKHVYISDLKAIWNNGQSLVVYQQLGMKKGGADRMIPEVAAKLRDGLDVEPIPLWFHRGTARVFFVVPQPNEKGDLIRERVGRFMDGPWGKKGHFELVLPKSMAQEEAA